jgi:mono/diheme cytochrome c family protein
MDYPFWDVDIGYGWLMGSIAVFHVFIAHFAIGGGLYLVMAEISARKAGDTFRLQFLKKLSKFFVLASVVMGALTGVMIWFIIGLLNPAATEVLIHHYVWGWAIEWTFFIIEICAAILYYYGWEKMSARSHIIIGWIYFIAAWMSLVVINGIITFMLTPGDWLITGNVWDGFFNPTYWPSVWYRTGICIMLAGVYALAVASNQKQSQEQSSLVRYNAIWGLVGLLIMAPTYFWYFEAIPEGLRTTAAEMMPTVMAYINEGWWIALVLAIALVLFGLILPKMYRLPIAVVTMVLGLLLFGEYEFMRESIRKPYVIHGYMYGNAIDVANSETYATDGYLKHMTYRTGDDGADLFRRVCRSCHTMDGYRPLQPSFDGTDAQFIAAMVRGIGVMKRRMPPYLGSAHESEMMAAHIYKSIDKRPLSEIHGLSGVELGQKVFQTRCGPCHQMGGYNDKTESLAGLEVEDYEDLLDNAADYDDLMPAFTGSDADRAALIKYLQTLTEGGDDESSGL